MLMAANRLVFDSQVAVQQWVKHHPVEAWKYAAILYAGNGLMIWIYNRNRDTRHSVTDWNLHEWLAKLKSWMAFTFNLSMLVAAFMGTFAGGIVCTAYLSSCLPWSRLLFCKCASSPSLSHFSLTTGSLIYSGIFLVVESIRQWHNERHVNRTPGAVLWARLEISASVIGWACLFMNALYVSLGLFSS
jgi:hypothetical protein